MMRSQSPSVRFRVGAEEVVLAGVLVVAMFLGCVVRIAAGRHIASEGHGTANLKSEGIHHKDTKEHKVKSLALSGPTLTLVDGLGFTFVSFVVMGLLYSGSRFRGRFDRGSSERAFICRKFKFMLAHANAQPCEVHTFKFQFHALLHPVRPR